MSVKERNAVVAAARDSLKVVPKTALPVFDEVFEVSGTRTAKATRKSAVKTFRLRVPIRLSEQDERISESIVSNQTNFVSDEYGRRRAGFSQQSRKIVNQGLADGKSSREISRELKLRLGSSTFNRNKHYWDTVSSAFINQARTAGELSVFDEAGIEKFVFEAALDEVTTDICRFMHGKEWTVRSGLKQFQEVAAASKPEDIKDIQPWVRNSRDDDGNRVMVYDQGGTRHTVARIEQSAVGSKDSTGKYSNAVSDKTLQGNNITTPPLHGL